MQHRLTEKKITLTNAEFTNSINISLGLYRPLDGFCKFEEYKNIILNKKVNEKNEWTIPILLNLKDKKKYYVGKKYYLIYKKKKVGFIIAESLFKIDKKKYCKAVFNTNSQNHPAVKKIYEHSNSFVGGKVTIYKDFLFKDKDFAFNYFKKNKFIFSKSTVFSTRNICHLGHQLIHEKLLKTKKKLCICIIQSEQNKFDPKLIINSYKKLKAEKIMYKNIKIIKIYLPSLMAGPNEAYLQAVCFNNLNFNSFFVGRDHAGYKKNFKRYESQKIFEKLRQLKIKIIKTTEPLICKKCELVFFEGAKRYGCGHNKSFLSTIDGKKIKKYLLKNKIKFVKKFLDPVIFKFCLNNISFIKKFKG